MNNLLVLHRAWEFRGLFLLARSLWDVPSSKGFQRPLPYGKGLQGMCSRVGLSA